jgi:hypothetical protein
MPQIVTVSYFQNANELNIPLGVAQAVANPTLATPNSANALTELCVKVEKSILLNALGLTTYNTLQLALADINNPLYASYKKLVQGENYDGKVWEGLSNNYSLIAYRIFEEYITQTNEHLTGVGNTQGKPEKATLVSPKYKIANANQQFIEKYQGGYLIEPIVYNDGEFIDWFGCKNNVEVSLYQYLLDKKANFVGFDIEKFKTYETKNSFGI